MHEWFRNNVIFHKYDSNVRSVCSGERSRRNSRSINNGEDSNCNWLASLRKNVMMSHKVLIANTKLNDD
jgi:hypothetical protein